MGVGSSRPSAPPTRRSSPCDEEERSGDWTAPGTPSSDGSMVRLAQCIMDAAMGVGSSRPSAPPTRRSSPCDEVRSGDCTMPLTPSSDGSMARFAQSIMEAARACGDLAPSGEVAMMGSAQSLLPLSGEVRAPSDLETAAASSGLSSDSAGFTGDAAQAFIRGALAHCEREHLSSSGASVSSMGSGRLVSAASHTDESLDDAEGEATSSQGSKHVVDSAIEAIGFPVSVTPDCAMSLVSATSSGHSHLELAGLLISSLCLDGRSGS